MTQLYTKLDWETQTFGYPVVRIIDTTLDSMQLASLLGQLGQDHIRLAYWFVHPEDKNLNDTAKKNKGLLVDTKVTYELDGVDNNTLLRDPSIDIYTEKHVDEALYRLALASGIYSRFYIDPHFTSREYEKLYRQWIEKSVRGEIADHVLIFKQEGTIVGFITTGIKDLQGEIGLLAVDAAYRGQHIGQRLVQAAIAHLGESGMHSIQVVTQKGNRPACALYEKVGFRLTAVENVYHFWL
jgi:dTDP-4-amino-4,6-dideoxy-D-galactose acyltransferase